MNTRRLVLAGCALLASALSAQAPQETPAAKIDLRVLLTGVPGHPRTQDFERFLRAEFATVGTTDYTKFTAAEADAYDVVIFDAAITPTPGRIGVPKPPELPADFARASVLVAGAGAILADPLGLKTDWG